MEPVNNELNDIDIAARMDLFYEVHNSYDKFLKLKGEYLSIISRRS